MLNGLRILRHADAQLAWNFWLSEYEIGLPDSTKVQTYQLLGPKEGLWNIDQRLSREALSPTHDSIVKIER